MEPIQPSNAQPLANQDAVRGSSPLEGVESVQVQRTSQDAQSASSTDRLEISDRSRELARALEQATDAPDVRADRIADLKERIANGTYSVSAEELADHLLGTNPEVDA